MMLHSAVPIPNVYFSFNSVSWSISTEIFFYMTFPLLLLWFSSKPMLKLAAAIAFGGLYAYSIDAAGLAYYSPDKLDQISAHGLIYISPLGRIQEFMLGIVCQRLISGVDFSWLKKWPATAIEILSIAAIVFIAPPLGIYPSYYLGPAHNAFAEFIRHSSIAILFAIAISSFYLDKGMVSRILSWRPFIFLGEISFSVYLIHSIVIRVTIEQKFLESYDPYAKFAFVTITSIICAAFIWKFVEKPCQRGIMRAFDAVRPNLKAAEPAQ
jgi:peptidoglycan/LPS O-acetylase OafA/YrhL